VTGGDEFVAVFDQGFKAFLSGDRHIVNELLVSALSVKRAVIELDEFELDIRRAMNYGHSIGHAIEALTNNRIPHGTAVVIGMLVENQISVASGRLSPQDRDRLNAMARPLVTRRIRDLLADIDLAGIVDVLGRDKKSEGSILKLALLHEIGRIDFLDFPLDGQATARVQTSLDEVLSALEGS
jgi:3-dehydroquinate synthase